MHKRNTTDDDDDNKSFSETRHRVNTLTTPKPTTRLLLNAYRKWFRQQKCLLSILVVFFRPITFVSCDPRILDIFRNLLWQGFAKLHKSKYMFVCMFIDVSIHYFLLTAFDLFILVFSLSFSLIHTLVLTWALIPSKSVPVSLSFSHFY